MVGALAEHYLCLVAIDGGVIAHGWWVLDDFILSLLLDKIGLSWPEQVNNRVEPNYVSI